TDVLLAQANTCFYLACAEPCGAPTVCDSGLGNVDPTCADCLSTSCCAEYEQCAADPGCVPCAVGIGAPGADCGHDPGSNEIASCQAQSCAAECSGMTGG